MKKRLIILLSVLLVFGTVFTAFAATASTEYYNKSGSIDGKAYVLQIYGNTVKLTASVTYYKDNTSRSVSIQGYYYDTNTGNLTSNSMGNGGINTRIETSVVPLCTDGRFVYCYATYNVNGWTTQSGKVVVQ